MTSFPVLGLNKVDSVEFVQREGFKKEEIFFQSAKSLRRELIFILDLVCFGYLSDLQGK